MNEYQVHQLGRAPQTVYISDSNPTIDTILREAGVNATGHTLNVNGSTVQVSDRVTPGAMIMLSRKVQGG